jgi:RING finger family protein
VSAARAIFLTPAKQERKMNQPYVCPICLKPPTEADYTLLDACDDAFCRDCIAEWAAISKQCPACNRAFQSWICPSDFGGGGGGGGGDDEARPRRKEKKQPIFIDLTQK